MGETLLSNTQECSPELFKGAGGRPNPYRSFMLRALVKASPFSFSNFWDHT